MPVVGTEKRKHRAGRPETGDKRSAGIKDAQIVEQVWQLATQTQKSLLARNHSICGKEAN